MDSADTHRPAGHDPIALYLAMLELALVDHNPALVHDALVDAETHLRTAVAAGADPTRAVQDFGPPEEIARAYVEADQARLGASRDSGRGFSPTAASAEHALAGEEVSTAAGAAAATEVSESFLHRASRVPIIGVWFNPYAWGSIFYFTTVGFAFALGVFVWITTMGSLSLGLLPFFLLGLPLLVLLLGSVRGLSLLHGSLCQLFLGVRMPRRTLPIYTTRGISLWQRILCWLRDLRSWLSLAYLLGNFPVSLALFVLFVVLTPVCAVMLGLPVITLFNGSALYFETGSEAPINLPGMALIPDASGRVTLNSVQLLLLFSLGLISTTCVLWLARGLGWVYGHVVQAIQVARPRAVRPRTAA